MIKICYNRIKSWYEYRRNYKQFRSQLGKFIKSDTGQRFSISENDLHPCLSDNTGDHVFDTHYIYHPAWAAEVLAKINPKSHVDISSTLSFSTIISAFIPTTYYDYRPAHLNLHNFKSDAADLTKLHFKSGSISCLSCMHVIEHVGLGRYGDPIDADSDLKAFEELQRVVEPGGDFIFVTPVGKPKVVFNAHRIYSFEQITSYFNQMELVEFTLVPDDASEKGIIRNASPSMVKNQNYGCGCFWFKKC